MTVRLEINERFATFLANLVMHGISWDATGPLVTDLNAFWEQMRANGIPDDYNGLYSLVRDEEILILRDGHYPGNWG